MHFGSQLKYLRGIAKGHVLLIIFFKNTEMEAIKYEEALDIREIYDRAIGWKVQFRTETDCQRIA